MKKATKPRGRPSKRALRWPLVLASVEFGVSRETLRAKLVASNQAPDAAGRWGTRQILKAIMGDMSGQRLRLIKEQADSLEIRNAKDRTEWIEADWVQRFTTNAVTVARQRLVECPGKVQSQYTIGMPGEAVRRLIEAEIDGALALLADEASYKPDMASAQKEADNA